MEVKDLIYVVCVYFGISESDLFSENRDSKLTDPRHIVMFILSTEFKLSDEEISIITKKARGTVWSGIKKINNLKIYDKEIKFDINNILFFLNHPEQVKRKYYKKSLSFPDKKIYQYSLNMEQLGVFNSVREAYEKTNVPMNTIYRSIRKYKKKGNNFYWIKK